MMNIVSTRPISSIIFLEDRAGGELPEWSDQKLIMATESCIIIRCCPEQDGSTEIALGKCDQLDPGYQPAFEGVLNTPSRALAITTVDERTLLEAPVQDSRTRVCIWVNDMHWPDKIRIGIS